MAGPDPNRDAGGGPLRWLRELDARYPAVATRGLSVLVLLGCWWVVALFFEPLVFPGPWPVLLETVHIVRNERFLFHLSRTLLRVVGAFGIALLLATLVGILMGVDETAERFFETFVLVGLTVPALAVSIIVLLVMGFNEGAGIVAIVIVITPPMTENVWEGTKNLDADVIKMGQVFGATRRMMLRDVVLPQLAPYLLAATRFGLGIGWKIAVIVEWIGLGTGIGQKLRDSFDLFSLTGVMAWTLSFIVVMAGLEFLLIKRIEAHLTRWQPDETSRRSPLQR
ncbi:ABC transporter permease [Haloplanus natans]|jgi:NitT/TauT family transport system permease protein|uniref:ABC transporter permease n=1 Tax=Haloplanus natans TaxID=376171 RepID=UPI00067821BB|nr:ABC transporter permease [Haloplanus natans]